jgi:S1-C subfamily serine protease
VKTAAKPAITLAPATKGCPFCGEQVLVNAVKCRHCGEFFDAEAASAVKRVRDTSASADRLNPAEYVVAIVAGPVGLVIGVVWKFKKLRKALDMLKISGLSCVIVLAIALTLKFYVFTSNPRPSEVAAGSPFPYYSGVPGAGIEDNYPPDIAQSGAVDMPPDLADLEQQPPEIRRAMKANVRITQQGGLGSGVIVRQEKNRALILTNRHVVDYAFAQTHGALQVALSRIPEPDIMYVTRENKKGKVIWLADDEVDLAIVDAPCPDGIEAVVWQATQEIQIGEQVFAVGNPMGLGWTFTRGVVSAMRQHEYGTRKVPVLQTDTRIGPGNSGGGLYNQRGELIGINTFVVSASQLNAGESGLGFAIRKNVLLDLKPDMMQSPSTPPTP